MGGWIQNMFDNRLSTSVQITDKSSLFCLSHEKRDLSKLIRKASYLFTLRDYTDSHNYGYIYLSFRIF